MLTDRGVARWSEVQTWLQGEFLRAKGNGVVHAWVWDATLATDSSQCLRPVSPVRAIR